MAGCSADQGDQVLAKLIVVLNSRYPNINSYGSAWTVAYNLI